MGLLDERDAVLELSKGKLTTDPKRHSGQGIFFTSHLLDSFGIISSRVLFTRSSAPDESWLIERADALSGSSVYMKWGNNSSRLDEQVFENFSSADRFAFNKTIVPVRLARYRDEKLVSRSQAKRLVARVDQFQTVLLDFSGSSPSVKGSLMRFSAFLRANVQQ